MGLLNEIPGKNTETITNPHDLAADAHKHFSLSYGYGIGQLYIWDQITVRNSYLLTAIRDMLELWQGIVRLLYFE